MGPLGYIEGEIEAHLTLQNNVLQGQVRLNLPLNITQGPHTLTLKAVGGAVIADQWMLDFVPDRHFYVFPVKPAQ